MTAIVSRSTDSESSQHVYFIAAIAIILAFVVFRFILLRRRNQALSEFFRAHPASGDSPYPYGTGRSIYQGNVLAPLPTAYRPDRRIHAADVDAHGRRLSGEDLDGKDALPAYDNFGGPPKYVEAGWSHNGPPPSAEQAQATSAHEGEQSGTTHADNDTDPSRNDTHFVNEVVPPPPVHHHPSVS